MNHEARRRFVVLAAVLDCFTLGAAACGTQRLGHREQGWAPNVASFEREIQDVQSALAIPGLAYVIVQDGQTVASAAFGSTRESTPFTTSTPLRIASVTKSFTAVVALQLVEEGQLDLDAPVSQYAPGLALPPHVRVRHLLTHTSEGVVGQEYVYGTSRYAMLGPVIEAITGQSFEGVIRRRVLERSGMQEHASPTLGPHAGLVSTTDDMGIFIAALDRGRLLAPASLERLASPSRSTTGAPLPVSLGWFTQTIQGHRVAWSFGQDDPEHSGALLLRVPDRGLSVFVLANANALSDPFRLLMGDVSKSPVAMSFMRLFVFSAPAAPLPRPAREVIALDEQALMELEDRTGYRYRDELIGWALVDLRRGRTAEAQQTWNLASARYDLAGAPDPVLHFAALRLPDQASKEAAIRAGFALLSRHPTSRWVLLAQGYLLQQRGRVTESSECFQRILDLPNQEPDSLGRLFRAWSWLALAEMSADSDPARARSYLHNIIDMGMDGDVLADAKRRLAGLHPGRVP